MGLLIAVEGIDGAGKTTQVQLLGEALREAGEKVVVSREPTDGPWGRRIRDSANNGRMSLDKELHAFVEDRKQHVAEVISPALERSQIVVLDRYFYSTIAYQGARGADREELLVHMKSFAPVPDAVLLLDTDPVVAVSRISNGRGEIPNEFERTEYLAEVRRVFQWLATNQDEVHQLDGHRSIQDVYRDVIDRLINGPLRKYQTKSYECDCWYCVHRETNSCRWLTLRRSLCTHAAVPAP
jgi:dTMP kinase